MKIRHIKPEHADFEAHIQSLKVAFAKALSPKAEYLAMKEAVKEHNASFYYMRDNGGALKMVSQVRGNDYFVWAATGQQLNKVAPAIIERVKACNYSAMEFMTYKKGMRRILRGLGFVEVERKQLMGGVIETVHRLEFTE